MDYEETHLMYLTHGVVCEFSKAVCVWGGGGGGGLNYYQKRTGESAPVLVPRLNSIDSNLLTHGGVGAPLSKLHIKCFICTCEY